MKLAFFRLQDTRTGQASIDNIPAPVFERIVSELPSDGTKKVDISGRPARILRESNQTHTVFAFASDQDRVKSSRLLKGEADVMLAAAANIDHEIDRARARAVNQTKRLIHNLKSLTAKIAQEIYFIALQDKLIASPKDSLSYLEKQISGNPVEAAKAFLAILKYQTAQKTEFSAFQKLNGEIGIFAKESHKVHKVLMNVFYLFFSDFTDKHIKVDVQPSELQGLFDYDSIHVAIYHLVENAAKYIRNSGSFSVQATKVGHMINIVFDMESLVIQSDEVEKIFQENYSGQLARNYELQGSGIGLFLARQMATANGGTLTVLNGPPLPSSRDYARNKFILTIPSAR